jgi:hypothetical protein
MTEERFCVARVQLSRNWLLPVFNIGYLTDNIPVYIVERLRLNGRRSRVELLKAHAHSASWPEDFGLPGLAPPKTLLLSPPPAPTTLSFCLFNKS